MINYLDALRIVNDEAEKIFPDTEEVDILQSLNRVIAEDVLSDVDLPPFDNSAMDGFAVKFSECDEWKIIGEISAGNFKSLELTNDEAALITTGGRVPSSADSVIPIEDVIVSENKIRLRDDIKVKKGMNVRLRGSDLKKDELVIRKYSKINSQNIAALATCGKLKVKVFSKLKLAVLATGDELVPINQIPSGDKIRVSNPYAIYAAAEEIGQSARMLGFVNDDREKIKDIIEQKLKNDCDILITTGGVSVGKYDFLPEIFKELNVKIKFWKVNIKPGKPIIFGVYDGDGKRKLIFGLPGNPVSSLVNFHLFVKPAVEQILNRKSPDYIVAKISNQIKKNDNKRHFLRGKIFYDENQRRVKTFSSQSSGNMVEMSAANCLVEIHEEQTNLEIGETVRCIMI